MALIERDVENVATSLILSPLYRRLRHFASAVFRLSGFMSLETTAAYQCAFRAIAYEMSQIGIDICHRAKSTLDAMTLSEGRHLVHRRGFAVGTPHSAKYAFRAREVLAPMLARCSLLDGGRRHALWLSHLLDCLVEAMQVSEAIE